MPLLGVLESRHARRAIAPDPIDDEVLWRLVEAARLAPSCFNNQPWRMLVVSGAPLEELRTSLSEGNKWATRAPVIIAFATKPSLDCRMDGGRDYASFDLGLAQMALMLQATEEGLIAHPVAGFSAPKAAKTIGLPEDFVLWDLVIVGKPGDEGLLAEWQLERERGPRQRKPFGEQVFRDRFGTAWI